MSVIVVAPIFHLLLPPRLNFSPQNAERYLYYRRSPRQIPSGKKLKDYEDILAGNEIIKRPALQLRGELFITPSPISSLLVRAFSWSFFCLFFPPFFFVFLFFPFFFFYSNPSAFPRSCNSLVCSLRLKIKFLRSVTSSDSSKNDLFTVWLVADDEKRR